MFSELLGLFAPYICLVNAKENIPTSDAPEMIMISRADYEAMVAENLKLQETVKDFAAKLLSLQQQVQQYTRMIFGSKSERFMPGDKSQMAMELEGTENPGPEPITETITYSRKKAGVDEKPGHSRVELPADLPHGWCGQRLQRRGVHARGRHPVGRRRPQVPRRIGADTMTDCAIVRFEQGAG